MSKVYSKDSFDRFGDDLCQHILSYQTIDQKVKTECVSKQWQRFIYSSQTELLVDKLLDYYTIKQNGFEFILNKCKNLSKIVYKGISNYYELKQDKSVFDSIVEHCN